MPGGCGSSIRKRWAKLWDRVDVILTPTTPIQAPLIGQTMVADEDVRLASTRFVRPFNVLGLPGSVDSLFVPVVYPWEFRSSGNPSGNK